MVQHETKRFDGRLDTLLRRNLPPGDYERVISTEPCVVVTPEGNGELLGRLHVTSHITSFYFRVAKRLLDSTSSIRFLLFYRCCAHG